MFIEEIIIDGFKSYATRTVISGFDPNFNAITGLNGSGKSNILDAICFVLGISNLSQVRVGNLQELVYKQGQAGITKASVTVVFNNTDPKQSPVGYEKYEQITVTRQVVIGGRNKYLINGHNAQLSRVSNLFHSVQLNVNNPHFLIMQGRITKVLNMKPPEILAMIEEAAGTRMFEVKKMNALKTIEKKQKKVEEINKVLASEITPTLEKLRGERSHYLQWMQNSTECERLTRFCIAYEYFKAEKTLSTSSTDESKLVELREEGKQLATKLAEVEEKLSKLTKQKEKQISGELKEYENQHDSMSKDYVKLSTSYRHKKETQEYEATQLKQLLAQKTEITQSLKDKAAKLEKLQQIFDKTQAEHTSASNQLHQLQRQHQAALAGYTATDHPSDKTLTDHLMDVKKEATTAGSEAKQNEIRIKHLTKELSEKKKMMTANDNQYNEIKKQHAASKKVADELKDKLNKFHVDENKEKELLGAKKAEEDAIFTLKEKVDSLSATLAGIEFVYVDPEPNFDRNKVKGLVANLISVIDPTASTALEVTAGGRLYNVVVDTEVTGKQLLSKGKLRRRVTIIPLSKISPRTLR
eukprot:TRINITY_DN9495_c0_g1_i1.p1 TRINITY_DN9495_c0_g1~~TRINITY_DN9495_c0_g1_i1.p1  ORF type:complete len:584 (-),score=203.12 TRINITY_DN9495_c0_g1_i1:5-1756(-)